MVASANKHYIHKILAAFRSFLYLFFSMENMAILHKEVFIKSWSETR